jgi:hypothetical protein
MGLPRLTRGVCEALLAAAACLAGCSAESDPSFEEPSPAEPSLAPLVRPDTPGNNLLFNFEPDELVETFGSEGGHFLVHFTRMGPNAVPAADADTSGVPDFVEEVAGVYEEVFTKYELELGFRPPSGDEGYPDNGGDGRFDVYLVDFAGQGDGHYSNDKCGPTNDDICAGYMVQENDYKGYGYPSTLVANRILGSHEFFHAVQAAYDIGQGSVLAEGTAVWATETFDPSLKDFEAFLGGYLDNPDRPLDKPLPGAVDPFSYGSAIYFKFLTERYDETMVRSLLERCENGAAGVADPVWFEQLDPFLQAEAGVSFADSFTEFVTWNLFTGKFADPERSYDAGAGYPGVKMTEVASPHTDDELRVFYASAQYYRTDPAGRAEMTAALVAHDGSPEDVDGLRLLIASRAGEVVGPVTEVADVGAGTETIDTSVAERFLVVVVNGLTGGDSRKPALCIGTVEEVAACRASITAGTGGTGGAGAGGGGGAGGAGGEGGSGAGGETADDGGCGCRVAGATNHAPASPSTPSPFAALAALAAATYLRRRLARATTAPRPTA